MIVLKWLQKKISDSRIFADLRHKLKISLNTGLIYLKILSYSFLSYTRIATWLHLKRVPERQKVYSLLHTGIMRFRNLKCLGSKVSFKYIITFFYVFSTVHHSIGLFLQPTLMHTSI